MTTHKQQAAFLDLAINLEEDASGFSTIQYRIYRKPGNTMAYLLADRYHRDTSHRPGYDKRRIHLIPCQVFEEGILC